LGGGAVPEPTGSSPASSSVACGCAGHSGILRSGFTHRLSLAADALLAGLQRPDDAELAAAVDDLAAHRLAHAEAERVRRVRMAQRLVRWLGAPVEPPRSVADGVDRQIAEWGWVDLRLATCGQGRTCTPACKPRSGRCTTGRRSGVVTSTGRSRSASRRGRPPDRATTVTCSP
jgi:hypothetical protein